MIDTEPSEDEGGRIRQILDAVLLSHRSAVGVVSPEVYEYLVELLKDDDDDDDDEEDQWNDPDALVETVASFLAGELVDGDDDGHDDEVPPPSLVMAERILRHVAASRRRRRSEGAAAAPSLFGATAAAAAVVAPNSAATPPTDEGCGEGEGDDPAAAMSPCPPRVATKDRTTATTQKDEANNPLPAASGRAQKRRDTKHLSSSSTTAAPGVRPAQARAPWSEDGTADTAAAATATNDDNEYDDEYDDSASAWIQCRDENRAWGGRGRGGRGEYAGMTNSARSNVHLSRVTLALPTGEELLTDSVMDIAVGHCYGLLGRNGAGKSTLLRRIAQRSIPGLPGELRVLLVSQEMDEFGEANDGTAESASSATPPMSALDALIQSDRRRARLLKEQEYLEQSLDDPDPDGERSADEIVAMGERLGQVMDELEVMEADRAEDRARDILSGLQFTRDMMDGPVTKLPGGWRMRLKLARALFLPSDLILLDECTNHLDLYGLEWLTTYLTGHRGTKTLMVVSHDRNFLDAICTDIVVLEHRRLTYHPGNYSEYERQVSEKAARESQILDAAERQRSRAVAFVQKQQQQQQQKSSSSSASSGKKKWVDPNKQRQAKMIRDKKLDRIGNYREDGKRYKTHSLQKMSEEYSRLAQKVVIEQDDPVIAMRFPRPGWPAGISAHDALIKMDDFSFGFDSDKVLFERVTLNVTRQSKVCVVGRNGAGKSTLVNLFAGTLDAKKHYSRGTLWVHPNVRLGHVTQYAVESLGSRYGGLTTVQYAEQVIFGSKGAASADAVAQASGNVRQYLGAFGLGGRHALQKVGRLSGGEKMRLCFAAVLAERPHVLLLDESTNHVDLTTLDSMSMALRDFEGAVVMVSHNQGFLSGFCNELWVVDGRRVRVHPSDASSFDEVFSEYRSSIHSQESGAHRATQRKDKADRAKVAAQQRAGARQATALLLVR